MKDSNIYSVSETILLKWTLMHYLKINPQQSKQLLNLETDFLNGDVYEAIITSHVGQRDRLRGLYPSPTTSKQYISNMDKVISCLGELGITSHVTSKDLAIEPHPINII